MGLLQTRSWKKLSLAMICLKMDSSQFWILKCYWAATIPQVSKNNIFIKSRSRKFWREIDSSIQVGYLGSLRPVQFSNRRGYILPVWILCSSRQGFQRIRVLAGKRRLERILWSWVNPRKDTWERIRKITKRMGRPIYRSFESSSKSIRNDNLITVEMIQDRFFHKY